MLIIILVFPLGVYLYYCFDSLRMQTIKVQEEISQLQTFNQRN